MSSPYVSIHARIAGLRVELTHEPSGRQWYVVPPKDNGGDGSSFSPTDLVAAALASCALATMALTAAREGLDWGEASARIEKHMEGPPRRIGALPVEFTMPRGVRAAHRLRLEEAARGCPVARSLAPGLERSLCFVWPEAASDGGGDTEAAALQRGGTGPK